MPGAHKIGAAISGPRITGGNFMDTTLLLKGVFSAAVKAWNRWTTLVLEIGSLALAMTVANPPERRCCQRAAGPCWLASFEAQKNSVEGCGGLRGENPAAFPKVRPIFQQPFSLPESAETLAGIAFRAAGKSVRNFPAASKFARILFQQGISDSHSLLEFSEKLFLRN